MPRPNYHANPNAPKFTPEAWISPGNSDMAVMSNCYQYAIAGSKEDGLNQVYDEATPDPGEVAGVLTNNWYIPSTLRELVQMDGLELATQDYPAHGKVAPLPPPKAGHYIVGMYVKDIPPSEQYPEGEQDYHFIRQDSDGGWSHKLGKDPHDKVMRYIEPSSDAMYLPLPIKFNGYSFAGYAYVPQEGIDGGPERILVQGIVASRIKNPTSCAVPNKVFQEFILDPSHPGYTENLMHIRDIGFAMKKHGISAAIEAYESCLNSYLGEKQLAQRISSP